MIVLVQEAREVQVGNYKNLEVKGINTKTQKETTQMIYPILSEKWSLVRKDKPIELVMQNKGTADKPKWQVVDIKPVSIPESSEKPVSPTVESPVKREIPGPERGMWWHEVGDNFRAGLFLKDEGNGALLWKAYIAQMLSSLEITIKPK